MLRTNPQKGDDTDSGEALGSKAVVDVAWYFQELTTGVGEKVDMKSAMALAELDESLWQLRRAWATPEKNAKQKGVRYAIVELREKRSCAQEHEVRLGELAGFLFDGKAEEASASAARLKATCDEATQHLKEYRSAAVANAKIALLAALGQLTEVAMGGANGKSWKENVTTWEELETAANEHLLKALARSSLQALTFMSHR